MKFTHETNALIDAALRDADARGECLSPENVVLAVERYTRSQGLAEFAAAPASKSVGALGIEPRTS
jgi:hypothetical protein